jgi:FkbM family methyltransferase
VIASSKNKLKTIDENWWVKQKAMVERIVMNTRIEPLARRLWWELRSVGRPYMRQVLEGEKVVAEVISRVLDKGSNCVDIGCNKGQILQYLLRSAPEGKHFAFEPIPELVHFLKKRFANKNVSIHELALGDFVGDSKFFRVIGEHGRSGFRKQRYPRPSEEAREVTVKVEKLDNVLPESLKVDFIKIDVEGAELVVLRGAARTIKRHKPFILFEHSPSLAASYGFTSEMVYDLLVHQYSLKISFLPDWLERKESLSRPAFVLHAGGNFLAHGCSS